MTEGRDIFIRPKADHCLDVINSVRLFSVVVRLYLHTITIVRTEHRTEELFGNIVLRKIFRRHHTDCMCRPLAVLPHQERDTLGNNDVVEIRIDTTLLSDIEHVLVG